MTDHGDPGLVAVRAVVMAGSTMQEIRTTLRAHHSAPEITTFTTMNLIDVYDEDSFRVGEGSDLRIEWHELATFESTGLEFSLILTWHEEWIIDGTVRRDVDGEFVEIFELPTRYAVSADELAEELDGQCRTLLGHIEQALDLIARA